tara:strand:- start:642 stop:1154 length:513 start_codon:yes stop_codon:yes gene_type:complete
MPKGLKQTSSLITIGARVAETAASTFTEERVDLQLNPLDNEVFVVQAIDLETASPDAVAGDNTSVSMSLTTTSQKAMPTFDQSAVLAINNVIIRGAGFSDSGVGFETSSMNSPPTNMEYLGIIATNDFFLQIEGSRNAGAKSGACKVYGYRARADASIYAALVQSELLTS